MKNQLIIPGNKYDSFFESIRIQNLTTNVDSKIQQVDHEKAMSKMKAMFKAMVNIPNRTKNIEAIKEKLSTGNLPEAKIPNSLAAKNADIINATAALIFAKSLNRPVRRAQPYECQDYFELQAKNAESANALLSPREAGILLDMTTRRFTTLSEKYNVSPEKSHGQNKLYKKEDVENMKRKYGPFYFD